MWQISAGLGLAFAITAGAFKLYYDKSQAEIESFHLRLEQSIQNQKMLEGTIQEQNKNLEETVENQKLMMAQVERLSKENMQAQNEVAILVESLLIKFDISPSVVIDLD